MTEYEYMHYCDGTWRKGYMLDCEQAKDHTIKLVQTEDQRNATKAYLEGKDVDFGGEG